MSTCNRLDLHTLGSQLVMSKNLPDHCIVEFHYQRTMFRLFAASSPPIASA